MTRTGRVYTPKETLEYEQLIRDAYVASVSGVKFTGPVKVVLNFHFQRPKSHYVGGNRQRGTLKPGAPLEHINVPDLDNLEKAVLDALNHVAWNDDRQVSYKASKKSWGPRDSVAITIGGMVKLGVNF